MMMTIFEAVHWKFPKEMPKKLNDEPHTLSFLTPCLLHDIAITALYLHRPTVGRWWEIKKKVRLSEAVFHGYWFNQSIKTTSPVLVSWYSWKNNSPYRNMLVAGNVTRKEQKAGIKLTKLPFPAAKYSFYDLWNKQAMTLNDVKELSVKPNNFRLIGIREGP